MSNIQPTLNEVLENEQKYKLTNILNINFCY